jgi:hypothetical protein
MKKSKSNSEKIWKIQKKSKLKCEMIWKIWKKPGSRAAAAAIYPRAAAATTTPITTAVATATRLLENPVEATTIVQNCVLLLVENVV